MHVDPWLNRGADMHDMLGLSAGSPIGFMAALGLLRVLADDRKCDVRLGWRNGFAVLDGIDPETAISELMANMENRAAAPEFNWSDTTRKVSADQYRMACNDMEDDKRALDFMAGWATDAVLYEGNVRATRMDMTSGNQKLLQDLRKIAASLTKTHLNTALFGGNYEGQSSFGLDPIAVRSHAHEPRAPTKSKAPGKPGLIWLAFESIPLHPVIPVESNRANTTGWRMRPDVGYVWPIWDGWLTMDEAFFLRTLPIERLRYRPGVSEVWFSKYGSSGKYGMLLPAKREL